MIEADYELAPAYQSVERVEVGFFWNVLRRRDRDEGKRHLPGEPIRRSNRQQATPSEEAAQSSKVISHHKTPSFEHFSEYLS
jgi:hypothetical protein